MTGKICGEPDLNRRTPARIDLESIAIDQAWLSPRLCWIMLVRRIIKVRDLQKNDEKQGA